MLSYYPTFSQKHTVCSIYKECPRGLTGTNLKTFFILSHVSEFLYSFCKEKWNKNLITRTSRTPLTQKKHNTNKKKIERERTYFFPFKFESRS